MPTPAASPITFLGTPAFAVPTLRALHGVGYPLHVVTQPDRPAGRGGRLTPPPVKAAALELGLPISQPPTLRDPAAVAAIRAGAPAALVVVAYGEILRRDVLALAAHGCLNVHPSLLPRWRGPTPIPAALLAGDPVTGVTVMLMDAGMDSGPILAQERVPVGPDETGATLSARLAERGAALLVATLARWLDGAIIPQPQDPAAVTLSRLLRRDDGALDWQCPAEELARQVRAYTPWPGTFTWWAGRRLKVLSAAAQSRSFGDELAGALWADTLPGTVVPLSTPAGDALLAVRAGEGWLALDQVQLEGRGPVAAIALLAGYPGLAGSTLGGEAAAGLPGGHAE